MNKKEMDELMNYATEQLSKRPEWFVSENIKYELKRISELVISNNIKRKQIFK